MPPNISALSQYQIRRFFQENDSVTQQQCDAEAQQITGQSVTATACQGGTSYTIEGGEVVVQFRVPSSGLDMDLVRSIEQAYRGFVPRHEYRGKLGQQLRKGLPERFHSTLDEIIPQLPDLFTEGWPLVPNHTNLLENNIHELRDHFWTRFYLYLGGASEEQKQRIEAARLVGLFLANGFQCKDLG
ncbi:hypothetical protein CTA1_4274 [Colletotrichum tanaceti]|uniref:Uncharacterized protein n=1 Tax=Colletotrichum tanaceti TaxID=1306861 RepID=A0A4U6XJV8_9PEZI|nr:hypothetical protein CTA1_4274 [Colletotrichum tanaceti]